MTSYIAQWTIGAAVAITVLAIAYIKIVAPALTALNTVLR